MCAHGVRVFEINFSARSNFAEYNARFPRENFPRTTRFPLCALIRSAGFHQNFRVFVFRFLCVGFGNRIDVSRVSFCRICCNVIFNRQFNNVKMWQYNLLLSDICTSIKLFILNYTADNLIDIDS